jgi:pimeloyl-ACP methyl ester carboxylesterase
MSVVPPARVDAATAQKVLLVAGASSAAVVGAAVSGSLATATYFARKVLIPDHRRPDDIEILAVDESRVTFAEGPETVVPGRYGIWLDGGAGHARVGDIVERDGQAGTVVRDLVAVDRGQLTPGTARWNSYYYWTDPLASMGLPYRDVAVEGELGPMPAWLLEPRRAKGRWAVLVHGRAARREECLRALPVLLRLGFTCLVISYRNDPTAPPAPDGRYNLGLSEWRDVESALEYAATAGATGVVLGGWSMGGAVVLQTLKQTALGDLVDAVFLDAPVVDWGDVLAHHARLHHIPPPLRDLGTLVMGRRATRHLVGVHDPVDVALTNWVARADEIRHRILIQHSVDDEFVPAGASLALAAARPDVVTLEPWDTARHCKEWNLDTERWERVVAEFLSR